MRAVLALIVGVALAGCDAKANSRVVFECPSPEGQTVAAFVVESGGGAAGWQYEAVVVRRPDDHAPSTVLKLKGGYDLVLRWADPNRLYIAYPDSARVDHWQDWFGRMADGRVEIERLPSQHGQLLGRKGGCEK